MTNTSHNSAEEDAIVFATHQIRKMRGGANSHLMLGSDGYAYVVKFQNNPQHVRILANELLASGLARALGLSVPPYEIIEVPKLLIVTTKELTSTKETGEEPCREGLQFGSRLVGGLIIGQTVDYLPECHLDQVVNLHEFMGMLVLDKWTCNSDGRQAVFHKQRGMKHYTAAFIDHGYCFNGGSWNFSDAPLRGVYARNIVYLNTSGWESFDPWLSRIEALDPQVAWTMARNVPPSWCDAPMSELEQLIEKLFARRSRVRELISTFRDSSRKPFPNWGIRPKTMNPYRCIAARLT